MTLSYFHTKKSGSKHLYLDYCKMRNLVQRDVKKTWKDIYLIKLMKMLLKLSEQLKTLGYSSKDKDNVNVVLKVDS